MQEQLDTARQILIDNDRGGFTVPTARLYPYQWNWDSAFTALGFSTFDRDRAWTEIETLFDAQWPNGMVPHIVFRSDDPDYFPGPTVWQTGTTPPSSGHSQPPVAASVVCELLETGDETDTARARVLFPKLMAYHAWFHNHRDPDETGLVAIMHPWESGRDNCPDWDHAMSRVEVPSDLGDYQRRDLDHVDADQRPSREQYDRFLSIIKFGRDHKWDSEEIYRNGPFLVADPGVQFTLLRADKDLLRIAEALEEWDKSSQLRTWIMRSEIGSQALWNEQTGAYCARDLRNDHLSDALTSASMLAFYADVGEQEQKQRMIDNARRILSNVRYGFPSWDPDHPDFESKRYWKGPVWAVMNYMIAKGLDEHNELLMAERIRNDTKELIGKAGHYEYFDPCTGEGLGGDVFTWTAAIQLVFESPETTN